MARWLLCILVVVLPGTARSQSTRDVLTPVPCAELSWEYGDPAFQPLPGARTYAGRYSGGVYRVEVPNNWNGELILWAHGNRAATGPRGHIVEPELPGSNGSNLQSPSTVGSPKLRQHWIDAGYAWAASSYRCNGSIPGIGILDTLALRDLFVQMNPGRPPSRTYLVGQSMGGGMTLRALEVLPTMFAAGLAMCPVVSPDRWDFAVSVAAAAEAIAGIAVDAKNMAPGIERLQQVFGAPARYTDKGRQLASVQINLSGGPRPFAMEGLAERFYANIQDGKGERNPYAARAATNRGVRYTLDEQLGLTATRLNEMVLRIAPDEALRGPRSPYIEVSLQTGRIERPLLTLHGTGDLQVPVSGQRVLRQVVDAAGRGDHLVQRIMRIPGHCRFSDEEQIQAWDDLVAWVRTGRRPSGDDVNADLRDAGRQFTRPLRAGDPGILTVPRATGVPRRP